MILFWFDRIIFRILFGYTCDGLLRTLGKMHTCQ